MAEFDDSVNEPFSFPSYDVMFSLNILSGLLYFNANWTNEKDFASWYYYLRAKYFRDMQWENSILAAKLPLIKEPVNSKSVDWFLYGGTLGTLVCMGETMEAHTD